MTTCFLCNDIVNNLKSENNVYLKKQFKLNYEKINEELNSRGYTFILLNFMFLFINSYNFKTYINIESNNELSIIKEIINLFNHYILGVRDCKYAFKDITFNMVRDIFHKDILNNNEKIFYKKIFIKKINKNDKNDKNYLIDCEYIDIDYKDIISIAKDIKPVILEYPEFIFSNEHNCCEHIEKCNNELNIIQENIKNLSQYNNKLKNENNIKKNLIDKLFNLKINIHKNLQYTEFQLFSFIWGKDKLNKKNQKNLLREIFCKFNDIELKYNLNNVIIKNPNI